MPQDFPNHIAVGLAPILIDPRENWRQAEMNEAAATADAYACS
jgi:hypothetical protein